MQQNRRHFDYHLKISTIGDRGVGKTKLTDRFSRQTYQEGLYPIGIDFVFRYLNVYEDIVKFQVWDPCGAERVRVIPSFYYRANMGIILVYDITNRESFTGLIYHHELVQQHKQENAVVIVVGAKADLEDERVVSTDEAREFAEEHGYLYIEASAKTGMNVDNLYLVLAKEIIDKMKSKGNTNESKNITKAKDSSKGLKKKLLCIG